ncbi:peptidoglycan-binding domain-containing protein [Streptomyces lavendulae]|uniref:peptidoglycan-binding domain-containing protein n=1 Tax=Streptomyces lavendulae TaxID=1914 RepID=UPI0034072C40
MSPHPDERAPESADRRLVRPYVTPAGPPPPHATAPAPPAPPAAAAPAAPVFAAPPYGPAPYGPPPSGSASPWPLDPPGAPVVPAPPSGPPVPAAAGGDPGRRRRSRLPWAALALLVPAAAGGLLFLLRDPAPDPAPGAAHPGTSLPALPMGSPGAEESAGPGADGSGAPGTASPAPSGSVRGTASPGTPSAAARPSGTPTTAASGPGTPVAKPPGQPSGTLRPGDSGPEVSELQERLYGQGFTYVSRTGVYDEQTRRGVAQLQRDRDIKGDPRGIYGPATRAAFG